MPEEEEQAYAEQDLRLASGLLLQGVGVLVDEPACNDEGFFIEGYKGFLFSGEVGAGGDGFRNSCICRNSREISMDDVPPVQ